MAEGQHPHVIEPLPPDVQEEVIAKHLGFREGLVQVGEQRHLLPPHCNRHLQKYYDFKFRPDDVLIMTFPRSGTTWTQEIVWTMRNDLDFRTAETTPLILRSPFMEFDSLNTLQVPLPDAVKEAFSAQHPGLDPAQASVFLDLANSAPSPRTLKTHLPFSLLNPDLLNTCKVVYVARNPRDVCVSYYHHQRLVKVAEFKGEFPEFVDLWCRNTVLQAPYWGHLAEGWERRGHPNLLFLYYEDMKEDIIQELRRLNTFLGTALTEQQLQAVATHTSFSGMKARSSTNPTGANQQDGTFSKGEADFIRKGITGDWTNYFTPELDTKFQAWMATGGTVAKDIPFQYHIGKHKLSNNKQEQ